MTSAISISGLKKTYENGFTALHGIDLEVPQGDFYALLGPNGAGKSTAIGIICSLINKSEGKVSVFGVDTDENFPLAKSYLGIVPQEINFSIFETPMNIVLNQAGYYGIKRKLAHKRAEKYLRALRLWDKKDNRTQQLSGGMKRRLMIARALIHEPRLLILDEPTAGVDIEIRRSMWEFLTKLNAAGTTIILTTHYLEEAEGLCRNIGIIDQGRLVENSSMKNLLSQLKMETFILDLEKPISSAPDLGEIVCRLVGETTLEVDVNKGAGVNAVFTALHKLNICVLSMRNKSNRLEQLFMSLVASNRMPKVV
ncbi:MAG: ABC transporter ATP-binding protein [Arenicellales bacterium WSBS_2016_MAG_OTU3]